MMRKAGGVGPLAPASALLSQSAACPAGGFSYKPELTPCSSLLPTPPKAPFIGSAASGLLGPGSTQLLSCCLMGHQG